MLDGAEDWEAYTDRLECFFEANEVMSIEKKRSVLLSGCGREAFALIRDLLSPAKPRDTPYDTIVKTMREHLSPQQGEIASRHVFYRRDQREWKSIAEFVAALRMAARHCAFDQLETMLRDRLGCAMKEHSAACSLEKN